MSASKRASGSASRSKLLPPGVDGVAMPSTDENGVDDIEVWSFQLSKMMLSGI